MSPFKNENLQLRKVLSRGKVREAGPISVVQEGQEEVQELGPTVESGSADNKGR